MLNAIYDSKRYDMNFSPQKQTFQPRYSVLEISMNASSPISSMSSSSVPTILSPPGEFGTLQTGEWTLAPRQNFNLETTGLYHTLRFPMQSAQDISSSIQGRRNSENADSLQRVKRVYL